jgi:hypothetical protein
MGVTHQPGWQEGTEPWPAGMGHGTYYSRFFNSRSTTFCQDCHRNPIPLTWIQTKEELTAQSDCYGCHWNYPHMSYDTLSSRDGVLDWRHSSTAVHVQGHATYLFESPLVTDTAEPPNGIADLDSPELVFPAAPGVIPILQNTCGGLTENNCHFDGYRSGGPDFGFLLCSGYCHNP